VSPYHPPALSSADYDAAQQEGRCRKKQANQEIRDENAGFHCDFSLMLHRSMPEKYLNLKSCLPSGAPDRLSRAGQAA
jgi:hypothetical protein